MKILFAYADWTHTADRKKFNTYGGIGYYRTIKISELVSGQEVKVVGKEITHFGDTMEQNWDNIFKEYDVFWTSYFADAENAACMYYHAEKHGKKVVIDIDDNYLDIPESNLLYEKMKAGKYDRAIMSTILSFADVITTSTEPLKARLYEHFKRVHGLEKTIVVLPNCNDKKDWDYEPIKKDESKVIMGYTGSNSHKDDLKMIMPAVAKLMNKYPNLYFEVVGSVPKPLIKEYFGGAGFTDDSLNRLGMKPATSTFVEYPKYLSEQPWDIGLAPLVDTAFTRSKSHIKWLEYSMYKIPTIASRVYPYFVDIDDKQTIDDGETGVLCKPNEWEKKLEKLITDKSYRERIGQNACKYVKEEMQYKDSKISGRISDFLSKF